MPVGLPEPEFIVNSEPRCPVILLLDTSGSMYGEPIIELNQGVKIFKASVMEDNKASLRVEVAVITFNSDISDISAKDGFVTMNKFTPPKLEASGGTQMGAAINKALDVLEERKVVYKDNDIQYYRPWIFLITDGAPTDTYRNAAKRLKEAENNNKLLFYSVGVEDADMDTLKEITPNLERAKKLNGLDFQSMFRWLSDSVKQVSRGKIGEKIEPPSTSGWETVIG